MPIIGKSDYNARRQQKLNYPLLARFRKGSEKPEKGSGKNLDYFRIEWENEDAQAAYDSLFVSEPDELVIATIGHTVEAVFDTWYRLYGGNNVLKRKCDGCTIAKAAKPELVGADCICDPQKRDAKSKDTCQPQGYFYFTIPQVCQKLGYIGQFILGTGSEIEIAEMSAALEAVYQNRETLNFAPFILKREDRYFEKDISGNGQLSRLKQSMVVLVPPMEFLLPSEQQTATTPQLQDTSQDTSPQRPALPEPKDPPRVGEADERLERNFKNAAANFDKSYARIDKFIGIALDHSLKGLFENFQDWEPNIAAPRDIFAERGEQGLAYEILSRVAMYGHKIRINTLTYDRDNNRHFVNFMGYKILMFSRDPFRKAGATEDLIDRLNKDTLIFTEDWGYEIDNLPLARIKQAIDKDTGEHKYFTIESLQLFADMEMPL